MLVNRMVNLTTIQVARLFHAKRVSPGKWRAVCPVHGGKYSGPLVISERKDGSTGLHCFGQCETSVVLGAVGLSLTDLFVTKRTMTPNLRLMLSLEDRLSKQEHRYGLAIMAQAVLPMESNYWCAVEKNLDAEIRQLRDKIYPEEKKRLDRAAETQRILTEYSFDELWECLP